MLGITDLAMEGGIIGINESHGLRWVELQKLANRLIIYFPFISILMSCILAQWYGLVIKNFR